MAQQQAAPRGLPCAIGTTEKVPDLVKDAFQAVKKGDKKKTKKLLDKGVDVDSVNDIGQSLLTFACIHNKVPVVEMLLQNGSNPNERAAGGYTAVHVACYTGNIGMLVKLLETGGDLRLHDNLDLTPKDWASRQEFYKKRGEMLEFLDKTRYFAMSYSGKDNLNARGSIGARAKVSTSLVKILKSRLSKSNISQADSTATLGFGKVYCDSDMLPGMISLTPLVAEGSLSHDKYGPTFNNGVFMVMESMHWDRTAITVKRLHRVHISGGDIDLLIHECEHISKLRHPCILLLMGVCQTNNLDGMILIYERVDFGSLFYVLHVKRHDLLNDHIRQMVLQLCDALTFIHQQHFAHCALTSHAVNVVNDHQVKVCNFEYMTQLSSGKKCLANLNKHKNAMYNWLSPEMMLGDSPYNSTDVYGLCVVIWEMFQDETPWKAYEADEIKSKIISGSTVLNQGYKKIPRDLIPTLKQGLTVDPDKRTLTPEDVKSAVVFGPKAKDPELTMVKEGALDKTENNSTTDIWMSNSSDSITPMTPYEISLLDAALAAENSQALLESGFLSDRETSNATIDEPVIIPSITEQITYSRPHVNPCPPLYSKRDVLSGLRTNTSRVRFNESGNDIHHVMPYDEIDRGSLENLAFDGDSLEESYEHGSFNTSSFVNHSDSLDDNNSDLSPIHFSYLSLQNHDVSAKPASRIIKPANEKKTLLSNGTIYDLYNRCNSSPQKSTSNSQDESPDKMLSPTADDLPPTSSSQFYGTGGVKKMVHRLESITNSIDENSLEEEDEVTETKTQLTEPNTTEGQHTQGDESNPTEDHVRITKWVDSLVGRITRNIEKNTAPCTTAVYAPSLDSPSLSYTDHSTPSGDSHWITEDVEPYSPLIYMTKSTPETLNKMTPPTSPRECASLNDLSTPAARVTSSLHKFSPHKLVERRNPLAVHASPAHMCLPNLNKNQKRHPTPYPKNAKKWENHVFSKIDNEIHCHERGASKQLNMGVDAPNMDTQCEGEGGFVKPHALAPRAKPKPRRDDVDSVDASNGVVPPTAQLYPLGRDEIISIETFPRNPGQHVVRRMTTDLATGDVTMHSCEKVNTHEATVTIKVD